MEIELDADSDGSRVWEDLLREASHSLISGIRSVSVILSSALSAALGS